ncbi:MAG TPA: cupin domain-containing protein [Methylomirabilota bacterium]|nr:cupin domain-containing protein [Methylomirabilota bacterium]
MRVIIAVLIVVLVAVPVVAQQGHLSVAPDTLKWVEPPTFPGARLAIVQGNPAQEGPFVYRLRVPANYKVSPHFHKAAENVTVLSGVVYLGVGEKFDQGAGQELPAGAFASVPPRHPHFAWAGNQETVVQVHGIGPTDITFVNPADDPRKK